MSESDRNKHKLIVLKELLDEKVITEEEYKERKKAVLDEIVKVSSEIKDDKEKKKEIEYNSNTEFNDVYNSQVFQGEWNNNIVSDNIDKTQYSKKGNKIINGIFSFILLIACILVITNIFLIQPQVSEDVSTENNEENIDVSENIERTKLTGEEAQRIVLESFTSPSIRAETSIYGDEEPSIEIEKEMYYQTEMREYGGHLMGIYYVHEYGDSIYMRHYIYDFLILVKGKLPNRYKNVITEKEALTLLKNSISTIIDPDSLSVILLDGNHYYSVKSDYSEDYYCLELDGSKLWTLDYNGEKNIYMAFK